MTRYAFYFDASGCTGCKACQIACKDKNNLSLGILWRRVIEVQGGDWFPRGEAWLTTAFTYFLSSACMHCERPICVEVCPTKTLYQREDGIVLLQEEYCIGCRYCEMACPYKALQFDSARKVMTKCDFCVDLIERSFSPACVSACQMRVLHFGDLLELSTRYGQLNSQFPFPDPHITNPAIVITPHLDSKHLTNLSAKIGNKEEI